MDEENTTNPGDHSLTHCCCMYYSQVAEGYINTYMQCKYAER